MSAKLRYLLKILVGNSTQMQRINQNKKANDDMYLINLAWNNWTQDCQMTI